MAIAPMIRRKRIRRCHTAMGPQLQVVSISSLKGGVGKTSVTLGLASAALANGISTLVVDLDPHADATTGLGVTKSGQIDIGHMLRSPRRAHLAENTAPAGWRNHLPEERQKSAPRLDVALGSAYTGIYDRPDLGRRDLRRLKTVLAGLDATRYDLVLIDCPPSLNGLTRIAWAASDGIVLVAEPGLFSVAGTERTVRAIELFRAEFAPDVSILGVVANRVRSGSTEHDYRLAEMKTMFGPLLLDPALNEQANWQQIQGAARSMHHWPGESAKIAAKKFDELLGQITTKSSSRRS